MESFFNDLTSDDIIGRDCPNSHCDKMIKLIPDFHHPEILLCTNCGFWVYDYTMLKLRRGIK